MNPFPDNGQAPSPNPANRSSPERGFPFKEEKRHAKTHQPRNPVPARGHPAHSLCSGLVHDHRGAIPPQAGNADAAWRPWQTSREGQPLDRPMRGRHAETQALRRREARSGCPVPYPCRARRGCSGRCRGRFPLDAMRRRDVGRADLP